MRSMLLLVIGLGCLATVVVVGGVVLAVVLNRRR